MAGDLAATLPLDESMIGVLVLVLVVLLSSGYVYLQQLQTPSGAAAPGGAATARTQRGGAAASSSSATAGHNTQLAPNAVATAGLTDEQLRLHRSLPSRRGGRTVTICADALLAHKESEAQLAWHSSDVPAVLVDLLQIADVYLLCIVRDASDAATVERIRDFVTRALAAASTGSTPQRALLPHKLLFCTTTIGKVAFVRQLEPQFHIEVDAGAVKDLEKHVPCILHVTSSPQSSVVAGGATAHHVADSVAGYFKLLRALGAP